MTAHVEHLPWDSEFFGVQIGRVRLDDADEIVMSEIDAEARERDIVCLYGSLDPNRSDASPLVQAGGFRLLEIGVTMARSTATPLDVPPTDAIVRPGTEADLPVLADSIALLAPWSRFAVDPRFGVDQARRLHEAWVERAAEGDQDRWRLVVAEDSSGIVAFATVTMHPVRRIDLMGTVRPGKGAPWALMAHVLKSTDGPVLHGGPIAVRNIAPLRFTEHCGFDVAEVRYLYHRWLDEGPRGVS